MPSVRQRQTAQSVEYGDRQNRAIIDVGVSRARRDRQEPLTATSGPYNDAIEDDKYDPEAAEKPALESRGVVLT